ncbi:RDD family protein [Flavobacterium sp. MK4S-17]|uniref:RDD family protein n=1 Tax=Flavobacterium sp. MK4S-17 TaxID=2543737 RepID=UPI001356915E|nr:RDD family protein [Flavobacterium sp. MK4S-17]
MKKKKTYIKRRFIAGFIDYSIIFMIDYSLIVKLGTTNDGKNYELNGLPALLLPLFWLIMTVGIEKLTGATLGNGIVGLKPVCIKYNSKITALQSLKRHTLDLIDMMFFGVVAIITIKNTKHNQRLGDLWAGTTVVKSESPVAE